VRQRWAPWLLVTVGIALVAAGVARVLAVGYGAGLVAVVVAGALLMVSPFILGRIERLAVGPSGLELQLTLDVAEVGAPKAARILERTDLARLAESYGFVYEELSGDKYRDARIHLEELLVDRAAAIARREKFDAAEVRVMFAGGTLAIRVLALGLMTGDPALADGPTLLAAITDPRSANEQYHGMKLAVTCWPRLPGGYRSLIHSAIESDSRIAGSTSRKALAAQIRALPTS
jgi:hypothetical protein